MYNDHYKANVQPIDLIKTQGLNFNRGSIVKYVSRAGKKEGEPEIKDLEKALWYLQREIKAAKDKCINQGSYNIG